MLKNKYKIDKVLGQGAMGRVFLAIDVQTKQQVAIKEILSSQRVTEEEIKRFKREYQFLAAIQHRNIIKAYDFFAESQKLFLVLEFISGIDLSEFIKQKPKSLTLEEQLAIAIQIVRGVEALNTAGILHRDIKPANIMIDEQKRLVKILDLGLGKSDVAKTKLTEEGTLMGTPSYMSPEQVDGKVTPSSDVFSVGVTLYQFFLWKPKSPFHAKNMVNTVHRIATEELPQLEGKLRNISKTKVENRAYKKLSDLIGKAIQKNHKNRLSARSLADGLTEVYQMLNKGDCEIDEDVIATQMWCPTMTLSMPQEKFLKELGKQYGKNLGDSLKVQNKNKESLYFKPVTTIVLLLLIGVGIVLYSNKKEQQRILKSKKYLAEISLLYTQSQKIDVDRTIYIEQKKETWQEFLEKSNYDSPYSEADNQMREKAKERFSFWSREEIRHLENLFKIRDLYNKTLNADANSTLTIEKKKKTWKEFLQKLNNYLPHRKIEKKMSGKAKERLAFWLQEQERLKKEKQKEQERLASEKQKEQERLKKEEQKEQERLASEKKKEQERLKKEKQKKQKRLLKYPKNWDHSEWRKCWLGNQGYIDFTNDVWRQLSHKEQVEKASAYQQWYAQKKKINVNREFSVNSSKFKMVLIPPGKFLMGSPGSEKNHRRDERQHWVLISKAFYLTTTETTQRQWHKVTGEKPWDGRRFAKDHPTNAANYISWRDVKNKFLPKLPGKFGLPTEAQWEYACRAGILARFYWGDDLDERKTGNYAWYRRNTARNKYARSVGEKESNGWGLYDMIGNLYEWCEDRCNYNKGVITDTYVNGEIDPVCMQGASRIIRGGDWNMASRDLRLSRRRDNNPRRREYNMGFRFVSPIP